MGFRPMINRRLFLLGATAFALTRQAGAGVPNRAPAVMLAQLYEDNIDPADYWISEKYDGVRAFWNGQQLLSRAGNPIAAPSWFLAALPEQTLDGELWIDRGRFENLIATVRDSVPDETAWRQVRYMAFDLPTLSGPFSARLDALQALLRNDGPVRVADQWRGSNQAALMQDLERVVAAGGEGLMLKRDAALYQEGRSRDLLKLKRFQDAEAQVIAHIGGQGKHTGRLGALEVRRPDGVVFKIGTGFSDAQRETPPPIGSWVTYRFHGTTINGIPRFASYLRQRE